MSQPLAERMRPTTLDEYIGQRHLVGEGAVLRNMILSGRITSFILWGPPGVGKTTLAQIIAHTMKVPFYTLSDTLHRRDTTFLQVTTGLSVRGSGERHRHSDRGDNGESIIRGHTSIIVPMPALCAEVVRERGPHASSRPCHREGQCPLKA